MCNSGASVESACGSAESGWARIASTNSSSCTLRPCLAICFTHPRPQILKAAELKLLHGPFGASEFLRDFADAFLLGEAHLDDAALVCGKPLDEPEESRALFDFFEVNLAGLHRSIPRRIPALPSGSLPTIGEGIRSNPKKPRRKRNSAPLEAPEIGERLMEYL